MSLTPLLVLLTVWGSGFLCLLNITLAIVFRARQKKEVISYYLVCLFEGAVFAASLMYVLGVINHTQVPFHLPPGLPINRAHIAAALAVGIGLFPAAYWHRINVSDLPSRIAQDSMVMKAREGGGVRVPPGEWMN